MGANKPFVSGARRTTNTIGTDEANRRRSKPVSIKANTMDRLLHILNDSIEEGTEEEDLLLDRASVESLSTEQVDDLVRRCWPLLTDLPNLRRTNAAHKILAALGRHRPAELDDSCNRFLDYQDLPSTEVLVLIEQLLAHEFPTMTNCISRIFSDRATNFIKKCDACQSLSILKRIAAITCRHPICLPSSGQQLRFVLEVVNRVASLKVPNKSVEIIPFLRDVTAVAEMVERIWLTSSENIVLPCLSVVYTLIVGSDVDKPPCQTLAVFLQITPLGEINVALQQLLTPNKLSGDDQVTILALVLCDWLTKWPKATRITNWLMSLFQLLSISDRSYIVADVILQKCAQLMEQSWMPVVFNVTFPVLRYMLLTYRHSEEVLCLVAKPAVNVFSKLTLLIDPTTRLMLAELAEVFHLLIDEFPTSSVGPLLQLISDVPKPNEERVQQMAASVPVLFSIIPRADDCAAVAVYSNRRWITQRSASGKVGLMNLGNTCYVNCILQALVMNQDFTRALLEMKPTPHQVLLLKLQHVMAFLLYSFRSVYSPAAFVSLSRPPWFETGRQQDCSEYLRYLLDSLYEQERLDRAVVQCYQRWTVRGSFCPTLNTGPTERDEADVKMQVTEGDLNEGPTATGGTSLSNVHSESTDSGIQSVGDVTESSTREPRLPLSLVHRIFGGKITTSYICLDCHTESLHQDFFTDLHLAFPETADSQVSALNTSAPQELTLESLLSYYLASEKLQGDNRYQCGACGDLRDAERRLRITEAPRHLLLTLLRFRYDRLLQRRRKITTRIAYPSRLELNVNQQPVHYALYAVVIHSGLNLDGGHYYTFSRENCEDLNVSDDREPWLMFNDSQVSCTKFQTLAELSVKYPNDTPYLLWYSRISVQEDVGGLAAPGHLRADLKELVDRDNLRFMREREQEQRRQKQPTGSGHRRDRDDSNLSRFVF